MRRPRRRPMFLRMMKTSKTLSGHRKAAPAQAQKVDDARWAAVLARDAASDGKFVTAVATTGIYCRPSCPARHPLRENVRFSRRREAAEPRASACKRCKPDQGRCATSTRRRSRRPAGSSRRRQSLPSSINWPPRSVSAPITSIASSRRRRRDAESLCGRASQQDACATSCKGAIRDRSHLQRRLQFERPLLRRRHGVARHETNEFPRGRRRRRDPHAIRPARSAKSSSLRARRACGILLGDDPSR